MITKSTSSDVLYFGCSIFISCPPFLTRAASQDNPCRSSQMVVEMNAPAPGRFASHTRRRDFRGRSRDRSESQQLFAHGELRETFALISSFFAVEPFQSQYDFLPCCASVHHAAPALRLRIFPLRGTFHVRGSAIRASRRDTSADLRSQKSPVPGR